MKKEWNTPDVEQLNISETNYGTKRGGDACCQDKAPTVPVQPS